MGILKNISSLFTSPARSDANTYWITAQCDRCGEIIQSRVNLDNDLSVEYGDGGSTYLCRKVLMGEGRCFQRLEVKLIFDANKRLVNQEISGGQFVGE